MYIIYIFLHRYIHLCSYDEYIIYTLYIEYMQGLCTFDIKSLIFWVYAGLMNFRCLKPAHALKNTFVANKRPSNMLSVHGNILLFLLWFISLISSCKITDSILPFKIILLLEKVGLRGGGWHIHMYVCIYTVYKYFFFQDFQVEVTSYWLIFYFQPITGTRNHPKKAKGHHLMRWSTGWLRARDLARPSLWGCWES